jgi:hypothetical protein
MIITKIAILEIFVEYRGLFLRLVAYSRYDVPSKMLQIKYNVVMQNA